MLLCEVRGGKFSWIGRIAANPQIRKNFHPQKNTICDRICEKVPFSHIKFDSFSQLSNFATFVSLQALVCNFP